MIKGIGCFYYGLKKIVIGLSFLNKLGFFFICIRFCYIGFLNILSVVRSVFKRFRSNVLLRFCIVIVIGRLIILYNGFEFVLRLN